MAMSQEQRQEQAKAYGRVVAKAWADAEFKQRLLANPTEVLREEGFAVPEGTEVRIVADTVRVLHLTLPTKPAELSDLQLEQVAGGCGSGALQLMAGADIGDMVAFSQ